MQPEINVPITRTGKIIDTISLALLAAFWLFAGFSWFHLPDNIPVHYNLQGQPDRYGGKISVFMMPLIATLIYVLLRTLGKYAHLLNYPVTITKVNAPSQYAMGNGLMRFLNLSIIIICLAISILGYLHATGNVKGGLTKWFVPSMIVLLVAPTVVFVWKSFNRRK